MHKTFYRTFARDLSPPAQCWQSSSTKPVSAASSRQYSGPETKYFNRFVKKQCTTNSVSISLLSYFLSK